MGEQTGELEEFKEFEEFGGEESGARIQEPGGASAWRGAAFSGGSPIVLKQAAPKTSAGLPPPKVFEERFFLGSWSDF